MIAVESDPAMARKAAETLAELELDNAMVKEGPLVEGDPSQAPYDVIFINGGVETIPDALSAQLRDGGRLVAIEMSGAAGRCVIRTRAGDGYVTRRAFDAAAPVLPGFEKAPEFVF